MVVVNMTTIVMRKQFGKHHLIPGICISVGDVWLAALKIVYPCVVHATQFWLLKLP